MRVLSVCFLALVCTACGLVEVAPSPRTGIPEESRGEVAASFRGGQKQILDAEDDLLDAAEKDTVKSLRIALGKEALEVGAGATKSAGAQLRAVRAAKIPTHVAPLDDLVELKIPPGVHDADFLDLRQKVMDLSFATMSANVHLVMATFDELVRVSGVLQHYTRAGIELGPEDYAFIRRGRAQVKRIEAIAGVSMGLMASYVAVLEGNADPKALDAVAQRALAAFPIHVEVSEAEAREWVASMSQNAAKSKPKFEALVRKFHGDKVYERQWKERVDETFARLEGVPDVRAKSAPSSKATASLGLDTVADAFPADGTIGAALRGVNALRKGDARSALAAAVSLIPVPGLKDAFAIASKTLFRD
jgi:hypothetical protein